MPDRKSLLAAIRRSDAAALAVLKENAEGPLSVDGETFHELQLSDIELGGIDFSNTEWEACMLDRVHFGDANLDGSFFNATTFIGSSFTGTHMEGVAMDGCVLRRVNIKGAAIDSTEISNTQLNECVLEDMEFSDAEWSAVTFNEGSITKLVGHSGTLSGLILRGVKVEGFDTAAVDVQHCATTTDEQVPEGFTLREGRRRRV